MFKTAIVAAAALCTAGLFAAPAAFAATSEVSYRDLDLATPQGQKELRTRIDHAARSVCRTSRPTTGTLVGSTIDRECYKQALHDVREHVAAAIDKADDTRLGG
ncbi:UrcA family protein [Novosphingobium resinovorum]|uniref:UrcA family protein n=1 Tax=Novosphingobium resinovorum TaxID=158500 RepID=UPI002ED42D3C|nr:UrcA family protein [Novosphingobium resinovorum]